MLLLFKLTICSLFSTCSLLESGSQTPQRCGDQPSWPETTGLETLSCIYSWRMRRWEQHLDFKSFSTFCLSWFVAVYPSNMCMKGKHDAHLTTSGCLLESALSKVWGRVESDWLCGKITGVEFQFQHISVTTPIAVATVYFTAGKR